MKYIVIRQFVSEEICDNIKKGFWEANDPQEPLNLKDGDDVTNKLYHSKRSPNLAYKYLTGFDDSHIKTKLKSMTGLDFNNSINSKCLPIFAYKEGGAIKAHRGVKKESNTTEYQEYVAVLQLTQRGKDFDEGRFYINSKATASADGKKVVMDYPSDRFYPLLNKGDLIIFHNPTLVHGVETVTAIAGSTHTNRITCSWRTNEKQTV